MSVCNTVHMMSQNRSVCQAGSQEKVSAHFKSMHLRTVVCHHSSTVNGEMSSACQWMELLNEFTEFIIRRFNCWQKIIRLSFLEESVSECWQMLKGDMPNKLYYYFSPICTLVLVIKPESSVSHAINTHRLQFREKKDKSPVVPSLQCETQTQVSKFHSNNSLTFLIMSLIPKPVGGTRDKVRRLASPRTQM